MDDVELIREFIRVLHLNDEIQVHVALIKWEGAHNPQIEWEHARSIPLGCSEANIDGIVRELLQSTQYFAVCDECGERNPLGWMGDESICQSCAERNHGIVY